MSGYKSRGRSSESMIEETQRWYTRMNHQRQTHPAAGSGEYYEEMCNTNGVGERQLPMSYKNEKNGKTRGIDKCLTSTGLENVWNTYYLVLRNN